MPIIKPVSDLRNNFNQIADICHKEGQPVFMTKNGQGDLVVMSLALYEKQQAMIELYQNLGEAEAQAAENIPRKTHREIMKELRSRVNV